MRGINCVAISNQIFVEEGITFVVDWSLGIHQCSLGIAHRFPYKRGLMVPVCCIWGRIFLACSHGIITQCNFRVFRSSRGDVCCVGERAHRYIGTTHDCCWHGWTWRCRMLWRDQTLCFNLLSVYGCPSTYRNIAACCAASIYWLPSRYCLARWVHRATAQNPATRVTLVIEGRLRFAVMTQWKFSSGNSDKSTPVKPWVMWNIAWSWSNRT